MIDIVAELAAIHRATGHGKIPAGDARTVVLRRRYDAAVDDVWDAITTAERINRWFLPITGDLHLGGRYQLEGNAGGEVLRCDAPTLLVVTWVFGENPADTDITEVRVELTADGDGCAFELTHTAIPPAGMWEQFGPGAVGVGWDLTLLGLSLHLAGGAPTDPTEWPQSEEARQFMRTSSQRWGAAWGEAGASEAEVAAGITNTTQFYAPDPT